MILHNPAFSYWALNVKYSEIDMVVGAKAPAELRLVSVFAHISHITFRQYSLS